MPQLSPMMGFLMFLVVITSFIALLTFFNKNMIPLPVKYASMKRKASNKIF